MSRAAFVADVHLHNHARFGGPPTVSLNRRCRQAVEVLRRAAARASALQCCLFVVNGDLFDGVRPEPQLVREVQRIFGQAETAGTEVVLLVGNHEQVSTDKGDHALAALADHATVVEEPTIIERQGIALGAIPFRPGDARAWLRDAVGQLRFASLRQAPALRLLAIHAGVADAKTAKWLLDSPDAIGAEELAELAGSAACDAVLAGNWHDHRTWDLAGKRIVQIGALVPTGFDNPGLSGYGSLILLDTDGVGITREEIPGPRFVKLGPDDSLDRLVENNSKIGHQLYVEWTVRHADVTGAVARIAAFEASGLVIAGEVIPTADGDEDRARQAARAASHAETLDEALASFVEAMPLPDGVDRSQVLALSRGYLLRGRGA